MGDNIYRDSEYRYLHDAPFRAAVTMLEKVAVEHGFAPGELKQIAFQAALNIERERFVSPIALSSLERQGGGGRE